mmetsp:Transcript_24522/g.70454  ORF Transcript_24522/g.70454 Transcript_24522/m.70454 type:complete len:360 (-) Transcript_24522:858-1937(-)
MDMERHKKGTLATCVCKKTSLGCRSTRPVSNSKCQRLEDKVQTARMYMIRSVHIMASHKLQLLLMLLKSRCDAQEHNTSLGADSPHGNAAVGADSSIVRVSPDVPQVQRCSHTCQAHSRNAVRHIACDVRGGGTGVEEDHGPSSIGELLRPNVCAAAPFRREASAGAAAQLQGLSVVDEGQRRGAAARHEGQPRRAAPQAHGLAPWAARGAHVAAELTVREGPLLVGAAGAHSRPLRGAVPVDHLRAALQHVQASSPGGARRRPHEPSHGSASGGLGEVPPLQRLRGVARCKRRGQAVAEGRREVSAHQASACTGGPVLVDGNGLLVAQDGDEARACPRKVHGNEEWCREDAPEAHLSP